MSHIAEFYSRITRIGCRLFKGAEAGVPERWDITGIGRREIGSFLTE